MQPDIVVIGAGTVGAAIALGLAKLRARVTVSVRCATRDVNVLSFGFPGQRSFDLNVGCIQTDGRMCEMAALQARA